MQDVILDAWLIDSIEVVSSRVDGKADEVREAGRCQGFIGDIRHIGLFWKFAGLGIVPTIAKITRARSYRKRLTNRIGLIYIGRVRYNRTLYEIQTDAFLCVIIPFCQKQK